jgi:pyruvate formate lyase activating enzyme
VEACDHGALKRVGREIPVAEVMAVVERDRAFYERSGGGLTVSGGEPLAQASFTRALLSAAKEQGLHTCLDTCGAGKASDLDSLLPLVDLVLFDYKATGPEAHRAFTGVDGVALKARLEQVIASGVPVILRVPLVPGVNDSGDHLDAVAALADRLAGVEVLPHHALGRDKRRRLGLTDPPDWPSATETQARAWLDALASRGCTARLG